ncbi:uncharacterized protein LOC113231969 isoform X2 [Hyposmocoma kahamanoa]|uniref:uncharacterized protein LOC113231969 isoform X2 n=1 Tax=Hyposmocoma kahamanoa TaxID=1477025 RepID=UPI000E6D7073|nr:uncharacterized protein LOC113231969 isoform X2 [Hyposmocoma kahamanoa]
MLLLPGQGLQTKISSSEKNNKENIVIDSHSTTSSEVQQTMCLEKAQGSDEKWREVSLWDDSDLNSAAKAALKTYEAKVGEKYSYLYSDSAKRRIFNGTKYYNITFIADYIPRRENVSKWEILECQTYVDKNLTSQFHTESVECKHKVKWYSMTCA